MLRSLASDSLSGLSGSANVFNVVAFFVFVFNLLLGNAYLFIPYVFYDAGLFASCLVLLFISFLSFLTAVWTLEVLCRSQALEYYRIRNSHLESKRSSLNSWPRLNDYKSIIQDDEAEYVFSRPKPLPIYEISADRKFEIPELCERFLGKTAKWIYTFVMFIQTFLFLWTTATVAGATLTGIHWLLRGGEECYDREFGKATLTEVPSCKNLYRIYIAAFGVLVMPFSCLRIGSQKRFQILLAICRIIIMVLVFGFFALVHEPVSENKGDYTNSSMFANESSEDTELEPFKISKTIFELIPIITCAQLIHFAIPNLVHITRARSSLRKSFFLLFFSCWVTITLHSLLLATYFEDFLRPNAPHTWAYFTNSSSISTRVVAYIIQLSPVLNGISVYPMLSVISADSLFSAFSGSDTSTIEPDRKSIVHRRIKLLAIFLSALPLLFALEILNVADISQFVNILSLVIVFVFPSLLQYKSRVECQYALNDHHEEKSTIETADVKKMPLLSSKRFVNSKYGCKNEFNMVNDTPYSIPYLSSNSFSVTVLAISILLIILSFVGTLL